MDDDLLEIGILRRAHGLRGQMSVELASDRPERVATGARWFAGGTWLTVRQAQRHQERWLVSFDEIADRTAAQRFTNAVARAVALDDPEALWVHELIGAEVVEVGGRRRGVCRAVVANPASDLLELDDGALVPTVFVVEQSDGTVVIDPPAGLFDDEDDQGADDGDAAPVEAATVDAERGDGTGTDGD